MKISPIRYMGNKKKLIKKGLVDLFPDNIEVFYDLFGGSGIVGMNVEADSYILNELDTNVFLLYKMFKENSPQKIINHTEKRIEEFELPTISTDKRRGVSEQTRNKFKENYMEFRKYYNRTENVFDLYVLMNYAMCQTMRFNKKGEFNMPFGNCRFIPEKHGKEIEDFHCFLQKVRLENKNYLEVDIENFDNHFVYLDPPYLGSVATYNENNSWTKEDNVKLLKYLDDLNDRGIKWGLSNILKNRNMEDLELIDWVEKNNYNIYYFDDFDYCTFGKGRSKSVEVLIYNYD